ncbi:hypothetical protein ACFE04_014134 [Oxalis oulophora]
MAVNASTPASTRSSRSRSATAAAASASATTAASSSSSSGYISTSSNYSNTKPSSSSLWSRTSLTSLRGSLPENPHIYDISEIRSATNNFLSKRRSSSSSTPSWRGNLRNRDTIIFQRKFCRQFQTDQLRERLSEICRSHHMSIAKILGVSISGDHLYLVYEFIQGASLADCLRNSRNPDFTVLSNWMSRIQIATDLAHGLDYIHNNTGLNIKLVHKHITSSSVIVTDTHFNAKLCHFGTARLCGEVDENDFSYDHDHDARKIDNFCEDEDNDAKKKFRRANSGIYQFEGSRGYMSPEFQATGIATQKSDVYAFGVVILELLSGEEPFKYKLDKKNGDFVRTSVIDMARVAVEDGGDNDNGGVEGRVRRWVDKRLKDSFPVDVAVKVTRLALDCVHVDPNQRPDMGRVDGKISKMYLDSRNWFDNLQMPTDISVSLAPR